MALRNSNGVVRVLETAQDDGRKNVLSHTSNGITPQFILLGDSLTQRSASTLQASLQEVYIRKLDVVNRGFSGYNAPMAYEALTQFLPPDTPAPSKDNRVPHIRLCTILLGSNDAVLEGGTQHVPVDQYIRSLRKILTYPVFQRHGTHLILVTPPPVNEHQLDRPLTRTAVTTTRYAHEAKSLAQTLGSASLPSPASFFHLDHRSGAQIHCLDLYACVMGCADLNVTYHVPPPDSSASPFWSSCSPTLSSSCDKKTSASMPGSLKSPPNSRLAELLTDGLHLSPKGYDLWTNALLEFIRTKISTYAPESSGLQPVFRDWKDICGEVTVYGE